MEKTIIRLLTIILIASVCFGHEKGDILSYFNFSSTNPAFGIDITYNNDAVQLHAIDGTGQVYMMDITNVSKIKDGEKGYYDSKNTMLIPQSGSGYRALAILPTHQGSGTMYRTISTNRTHYRTIWGHPEGNDPGSMEWSGGITGAWQLLSSGDFTSASYEINNPDIWTAFSGTVDGTEYNAVFRYPSAVWTGRYEFTEQFDMPKSVSGVALGASDDLWVLCQDAEILRISSIDGEILDRFFLDTGIANSYGIAYDQTQNSLWVSSSDRNIYQVAVPEPTVISLLGLGVFFVRKRMRN